MTSALHMFFWALFLPNDVLVCNTCSLGRVFQENKASPRTHTALGLLSSCSFPASVSQNTYQMGDDMKWKIKKAHAFVHGHCHVKQTCMGKKVSQMSCDVTWLAAAGLIMGDLRSTQNRARRYLQVHIHDLQPCRVCVCVCVCETRNRMTWSPSNPPEVSSKECMTKRRSRYRS